MTTLRPLAALALLFPLAAVACRAQMPDLPDAIKLPQPTRPSENWSVLKVDPAALQAMSYAVIGTSEEPEFTRELIRVQWRAGDPIDLFVIRPKGVPKPPVLLYLYSFPNDTDRFWDAGWCRRATKDGFAAVGFVSALTGQRYANRPMKEWFVSELQESLGSTTHDVQMILSYLGLRGDLAADRVGMYGQGSGGTVALLAAAVDPRIVAIDVLDPWGDWPDWYRTSPEVPDEERAAYLEPRFLQAVAKVDPIAYLPTLKLQAVRIQQVQSEPITPTAARQKIAAAANRNIERVDFETEQDHLKAYRKSGLSLWLRLHVK